MEASLQTLKEQKKALFSIHIDLTIPESGLFRATLHTAPVRVTFTSFLPTRLHYPPTCTLGSSWSGTLPHPSLTASWPCVGSLSEPFPY